MLLMLNSMPVEYILLTLNHFSISELLSILYSRDEEFKKINSILSEYGKSAWAYKPFRPNYISQIEKDETFSWQEYIMFIDLSHIAIEHKVHDQDKILRIFLDLPNTFPNIRYLVWKCDIDVFYLLYDVFSFIIFNMKQLVCLDAPYIFSRVENLISQNTLYSKRLLHLDISYCDMAGYFDPTLFPNLISLRAKGCDSDLLSKIIDGLSILKQLQYMDISDSIFLTIDKLQDILTFGLAIKSLIILNCPAITRSCIYQLNVNFIGIDIIHNSELDDHSEDAIKRYIIDRFISQTVG